MPKMDGLPSGKLTKPAATKPVKAVEPVDYVCLRCFALHGYKPLDGCCKSCGSSRLQALDYSVCKACGGIGIASNGAKCVPCQRRKGIL